MKKERLLSHIETFLGDIILGINDGLVSILGFVSGAYGAIENNLLVFITGIAATLAAALSMASGVYLARKSEQEFQKNRFDAPLVLGTAVQAGMATGLGFLIFSLFPLLPYLLLSGFQAFVVSIVFTLLALFFAGATKTFITKEKNRWLLRGIEMMLIGSVTALISYITGVWIGKIAGISFKL